MPHPLAYFVGDHSRSEFLHSYQIINNLLQNHNWQIIRQKNLHFNPQNSDLFVWFQAWPNEFHDSLLHHIKNVAPLAPIIILAGTCIEGELRTGRPVNGAFRIYTHQWNYLYSLHLTRFLQNQSSLFSLPSTFENEEVVLCQEAVKTQIMEERLKMKKKRCLIVTRDGPIGNDSAMNHLLADLYKNSAHCVYFERTNIDNTFDGCILADVDDSPFSEILKAVQRLRQDFADAEIKVCINSPRINERIDLHHAGADEILSKPMFW